MADILHITKLSETFELAGLGKPAHPLIAVIREWPEGKSRLINVKMSSDLYFMALKGKKSGAFKYGRNAYDYDEGTMIFMGPGQVATFGSPGKDKEEPGWTLLFHPDLIRRSELGKTIHTYSFFNYDANEALHLSDKEKQFINTLVKTIEQEINQNFDKHSQDLIVQNLETILKYSNRYYDRQFYTRTNLNQDVVTRFENYLHAYFGSGELAEKGLPSINQCGEAMHMSGPYLSDLLRVETGSSAKDHIHRHLIEQAKTILLNSASPVSEIAFKLGFEYPQNFSKLFKAKTGMSPSDFRNMK